MTQQWLVNFLRDEEGASGIEYALVATMVALALVAFVEPVRTAITGIFGGISGALSTD
jgi:pilus assembly protein Flp/PilA